MQSFPAITYEKNKYYVAQIDYRLSLIMDALIDLRIQSNRLNLYSFQMASVSLYLRLLKRWLKLVVAKCQCTCFKGICIHSIVQFGVRTMVYIRVWGKCYNVCYLLYDLMKPCILSIFNDIVLL